MEQITYEDIGINLFDERHIYSDEKGEVYIDIQMYIYVNLNICINGKKV